MVHPHPRKMGSRRSRITVERCVLAWRDALSLESGNRSRAAGARCSSNLWRFREANFDMSELSQGGHIAAVTVGGEQCVLCAREFAEI